MALPAIDAFTDTTGTLLTAHGTSWTDNSGRFDIQSNQVCNDPGTTGATVASHWNADAFNNNQYGQLVVSRSGTGDFFYLGPAVRCASGATDTFYGFWNGPDENRLVKKVAGTETQIGSSGTSWVPSGGSLTQRLEVSGTTLTPLINGSTTGTPGTQTDAAISSGSAGITGWSFSSGTRTFTQGDSWEGGNLGGAPVTVTTNVGSAQADAVNSAVTAAVTVVANISSAQADGVNAAVTIGIIVTASVGSAQAAGVSASVSAAVTVNAALGSSQADGVNSQVQAAVTVKPGVGAAGTDGVSAAVAAAVMVASRPGIAQVGGITAAITAAITALAGPGSAEANGINALVTGGVTAPTPAERIYRIPAEYRAWLIDLDLRVLVIAWENRVNPIDSDNRGYKIAVDIRKYEVQDG